MSDALANAFNELCAVCRPRPDQDEEIMQAGARRLWKVLTEYREEVAIQALDAWPKHSEWFPTEKELRSLLDRLKLDAATTGDTTRPDRFARPVGRTKNFFDRVSEVRGKAYANSWLRGGVTAEFSANYVFVTEPGHDRLWRDCENLIRETGVAIVIDPEVGQLIIDYMEKTGIGAYEQKRRRA
jgi:hypothetical protein